MAHPISEKLIHWYLVNKRDLPWRNTTDPYKIWLSEIMLQQTQVIQGLNYYIKFTEHFPTINDLANAPEDKVMMLWQGLGYYSRARNLHFTAKFVQQHYNGIFPNNYTQIKELKGVGDYTAAAIASFAFRLPHAVVDGNVYRVLARLFNINTPINSTLGKKEFQLLADELLNKKKPSLHNSAIMEFGALFCKPQNPNCDSCPLQVQCLAFANKTVGLLPVKTKTIKIKERFFNYVVFNYKNFIFIKKRTQKDIWQNLYEFYLTESDAELAEDSVINDLQKQAIKEFHVKSITKLPKHILSHQHIFSTFYDVEIKTPLKKEGFIKIKKEDLIHYGTPQLIQKYLTLKDKSI